MVSKSDWTKKLTAKKILALFGEGLHDGAPPAGLMLDPGAVNVQQKVKAVSDKAFMDKSVDALTKGIQQIQAESEMEVMQIAPVPAYLAMDEIEEAVPAGQILERLGKHHDANKEYIQHLKDFLSAAVVIHNKTDPKNELEKNTLFQSLGDTHVRVWSKAHFEELIEPPVAPVPVPPSTPQAACLSSIGRSLAGRTVTMDESVFCGVMAASSINQGKQINPQSNGPHARSTASAASKRLRVTYDTNGNICHVGES